MANRTNHPWAIDLSRALYKWFPTSKYSTIIQMGQALGVSQDTIRHIFAGNIIAKNAEIYARIFVESGIPEADPCRIPPLAKRLPNGAKTILRRAWTEEEYLTWLNKEAGSSWSNQDIREVQEISSTLIMLLEKFYNGSSGDRNTLMRLASKELGKLYFLLAILTLDPASRERSLVLTKEYGQNG